MNRLKKFWTVFLSFLPWAAGAGVPLLIGGVAGVGMLAGFSIYRTSVPVSPTDAYQFFSSCWTCQMFSDIMATMSGILPRIYHALGQTIVPFTIMLTAIWWTWKIVSGLLNGKVDAPWTLASTFVNHISRLAIVCIFLLAPLPRLISDVAITPIFNIGLSLNRAVVHDDGFDTCVISTALTDSTVVDSAVADSGAFSPTLRHNLACELSGVHQMTGMGMTVGWTMLNMAFDADYMHKILWGVPIFPNVILFFAGLLVLILFFSALLPIPIYFLEIFITLALDMVMLPFMLLAWLFKGWQISLAGAGKTIRGIVDDVINGTLGLAMTGIFVSFAIMFLDAVFGDWNGVSALSVALTQNDSKFLMDALMMRNDGLITVIFMGIFLTMFMIMIPALAKSLFDVQISTDFYDTTKKNLDILWQDLKKWYSAIKK